MNGRLVIWHPNVKNTGMRLEMRVIPAEGENDGRIRFNLFRQSGVSYCVYKDSTIQFDLSFEHICDILWVFNGCAESLRDGRGIFLDTDYGYIRVSLKHVIEPCHGYVFEVQERECDPFRIAFTPAEALGLCRAIENTLGAIAFGV